MTEKLYDQDSHLAEFQARVLDCRQVETGWAVTLDRTAFFPESGGQGGDTGVLNGVRVLDTRLEGDIVHYTDAPLPVGEAVQGKLDWQRRLRRMQNHSGEHILSGLVFRQYGYANVGFHLGDGEMTVDFSGELAQAQLDELETLANGIIAENAPVRCWYPRREELAKLNYRSKLELTEDVRLVEIGDCDLCACCAPHVSRTGEVGSLHILDWMRHRGGVRLQVLCGLDAVEDARRRRRVTAELSALLSAPPLETPQAVRRCLAETERLKLALRRERQEKLRLLAASVGQTEGHICLFVAEPDMDALRELVNACMEKTPGVCAAFSGQDGDYQYVIGSRRVDLRLHARALNAALQGRGGGRAEMLQGRAAADREEIEAFFRKWEG